MKPFALCSVFICYALGLIAQPANLSGSRIAIAGGNRYTNTNLVTVELFSLNATHMMISSSPTLAGATWQRFDKNITWQLPKQDGVHTLYAKFKDAEGKESAIVKDDIILDMTPPEKGSIKIKTETGYINKKMASERKLKVDLSISAVDAEFMMLSNSNSFYAAKWQIYQPELLDWQLEEGEDGPRQVFIKFKDKAQNESQVTSDKIIIDRIPPVDCGVIINNAQDIYATSPDRVVTLNLKAREAAEYTVNETADTSSELKWFMYAPQVKYTLSEGDGKKTVYVKFRDLARNESEYVKDDILLDITPPQNCSIVIDKGAETTKHDNKLVTLTITCSDPDVELMQVSNNPQFAAAKWQSYAPTIPWTLDGEDDGIRTVYVRFKDKAGNISKTFQDDIMLQRGIGPKKQ
ncbi:MAG: hypothetical protein NZM38_11135 [Cytophagales bacterium]|nr:hypothetical protein [Cytophagales bacterium]MDW8385309.1 hypothetical protein [Flammeovirgaceae bacterium]